MATNGASGNWCQSRPGKPGRCGPHGTTAGVRGTIAHKKNRCAGKGLRSATPRIVPELHLALRGSHQPTRDHSRSSALNCPEEDKARRRRSRTAGRRREREAQGKTASDDTFLASFIIRFSRRKRHEKRLVQDRFFVFRDLVFRRREGEKEPLPGGDLARAPRTGRW